MMNQLVKNQKKKINLIKLQKLIKKNHLFIQMDQMSKKK